MNRISTFILGGLIACSGAGCNRVDAPNYVWWGSAEGSFTATGTSAASTLESELPYAYIGACGGVAMSWTLAGTMGGEPVTVDVFARFREGIAGGTFAIEPHPTYPQLALARDPVDDSIAGHIELTVMDGPAAWQDEPWGFSGGTVRVDALATYPLDFELEATLALVAINGTSLPSGSLTLVASQGGTEDFGDRSIPETSTCTFAGWYPPAP